MHQTSQNRNKVREKSGKGRKSCPHLALLCFNDLQSPAPHLQEALSETDVML